MHVANFSAYEDPQDTSAVEGIPESSWLRLVEQLLDRGADPNTCDVDARTPLELAVTAGHQHIAELLLARGAAVDSQNRWERNITGVVSQVNSPPGIRDLIHEATEKALVVGGDAALI